MTDELLKIVESQQMKIDALEYLMTKIDLEPILEDLNYFISTYGKNPMLQNHRDVLIKTWEDINAPHKWEQD